jgi:hypothetical protein
MDSIEKCKIQCWKELQLQSFLRRTESQVWQEMGSQEAGRRQLVFRNAILSSKRSTKNRKQKL